MPWGKANFNADAVQGVNARGYLFIDGTFEIGCVLYQEMKNYDPYADYIKSAIPSIIIHAEKDTHVSYSVSRDTCRKRKNCDLFTTKGSDHGFGTSEGQAEAIDSPPAGFKKYISLAFDGQDAKLPHSARSQPGHAAWPPFVAAVQTQFAINRSITGIREN